MSTMTMVITIMDTTCFVVNTALTSLQLPLHIKNLEVRFAVKADGSNYLLITFIPPR